VGPLCGGFVSAGTDLDCVISIGLLRQSLRARRNFGLPRCETGMWPHRHRFAMPVRPRHTGTKRPRCALWPRGPSGDRAERAAVNPRHVARL